MSEGWSLTRSMSRDLDERRLHKTVSEPSGTVSEAPIIDSDVPLDVSKASLEGSQVDRGWSHVSPTESTGRTTIVTSLSVVVGFLPTISPGGR
jgi:hypothetical protein